MHLGEKQISAQRSSILFYGILSLASFLFPSPFSLPFPPTPQKVRDDDLGLLLSAVKVGDVQLRRGRGELRATHSTIFQWLSNYISTIYNIGL